MDDQRPAKSRVTIIDLTISYNRESGSLIVISKGRCHTEIVSPINVHNRINAILLDHFLITSDNKVVSDHGITAQIAFSDHSHG